MMGTLWELGSVTQPVAYAQAVSDGGRPSADAKHSRNDTKIIPSIVLTERYDSNVLFAPSGVNLGRPKWDFVTTAAPALQVLNTNRYADTNVLGGVSGNLFVNNSELNFIATNLTGTVTLDKFINQFIRGAKLQVSDSFSYSPETPSFVSAGAPTVTDNPFARGLIPLRVDMYTNTASVAASYPITPGLTLSGNYAYSLLRIGEIYIEPSEANQAVFFDTDQHTWSLGPNWRISRSDTLSVMYKSTLIDLRDTTGQRVNLDFAARGVEASYSIKAADWGAALSGGATVLDQDNQVYATGALTLSAKYGDATHISVTGSRQIAPGFFGVPGALISTTAGISVEHRFQKTLSLTGNANYAYNEIVPDQSATFESYTASAALAYNLTRTMTASLIYSYTYFSVDSGDVASQSAAGYLLNRHFVSFSLTAKWN
jgi:Putative beta-barrel porin 2